MAAVAEGAALPRFADEAEPRRLVPGDLVEIAPHRRHRVDWTDPEQPRLGSPRSTGSAAVAWHFHHRVVSPPANMATRGDAAMML
jgi:hypothetical protein